MPNASPSGLDIHQFIEYSPIATLRLNTEGRIVEFNQATQRLLGLEEQHATNPLSSLVHEEDRQKFQNHFQLCVQGEATTSSLALHFIGRTDTSMNIITHFTRMQPTDTTKPPVFIVHLIDQTEQKNLELRFAHSQKMQAVGQLAGGVAHDFNNLLTAMIGFCDLLLMRHPAGDPSFADIMQVKQNANRAANLVRQLLAFSRKQTLQPKLLDLTDVLAELSNLVRRLIGENIDMKITHGRDLGSVKADQGQLEQVIINLAVNARDAMTGGGHLNIRTSNVKIPKGYMLDKSMIAPAEEENILPGDYVLVEVEDTGAGIPPEIIKNIFEPFFSTKAVGSGTGLGLSTCYGIVKQTGGYIYVKSTPGVGTVFSLYFKRHATEETIAPTAETTQENTAHDLTGQATIMLVEDETPVRIFAARALRNKGYKVLEADCGETALEVFATHHAAIDIIISDVVMPGMNGPQMVLALEKTYPERMTRVHVVFISGYAEDAFVDSFGTERSFHFLPKPFTLKQLATKVKDVIDGTDQVSAA